MRQSIASLRFWHEEQPNGRWKKIQLARDATIFLYIVYRIIFNLYRCIDTKSNHIDISRIMMYQHIVACFKQIIVHCGQCKWYIMLLNEEKKHLCLLKATQNNVLTPHHIEKYIAVSWFIRGNNWYVYTLYRCNSTTHIGSTLDHQNPKGTSRQWIYYCCIKLWPFTVSCSLGLWPWLMSEAVNK